MKLKELIGRRITNIYGVLESNVGGIDTAECFVELDNTVLVEVPSYDCNHEVFEKDLVQDAISIIPVHTDEMTDEADKAQAAAGKNPLVILYSLFRKKVKRSPENNLLVAEFIPYKEIVAQDKPRYVKDRKIIDFLWYPDKPYHSGFFLLENGCLIGETIACMHGSGKAGLNYFHDIEDLIHSKGDDFRRITTHPGC